jgi:hypothetical protein
MVSKRLADAMVRRALRSRLKLKARLRKRPSKRLVTLYLSNDGMRKIRMPARAVEGCASYCLGTRTLATEHNEHEDDVMYKSV